ncbi:MAG: 3-carboxy-cis,cis-muconate cycloisomerase, partial [Sulfitobacter sp.]
MHHAMVHEQERSGAAWALEWMILPQMAMATARALTVAIDLSQNITRLGSD